MAEASKKQFEVRVAETNYKASKNTRRTQALPMHTHGSRGAGTVFLCDLLSSSLRLRLSSNPQNTQLYSQITDKTTDCKWGEAQRLDYGRDDSLLLKESSEGLSTMYAERLFHSGMGFLQEMEDVNCHEEVSRPEAPALDYTLHFVPNL
ncbi:hypothetical protein Bbelb_306770 [Branchiostoma belcheri]|nr:hypothetical protein Bbelb_306770 [Branchiostoma belcheri]